MPPTHILSHNVICNIVTCMHPIRQVLHKMRHPQALEQISQRQALLGPFMIFPIVREQDDITARQRSAQGRCEITTPTTGNGYTVTQDTTEDNGGFFALNDGHALVRVRAEKVLTEETLLQVEVGQLQCRVSPGYVWVRILNTLASNRVV